MKILFLFRLSRGISKIQRGLYRQPYTTVHTVREQNGGSQSYCSSFSFIFPLFSFSSLSFFFFRFFSFFVGIFVVKVKVSHSPIAVGAVGARVPLYLGHSWWKVEPILLLSLPYPSLIQKRYPFTAGLTERVFQSPHSEAQPRTHATRRLSALQPSCSNHSTTAPFCDIYIFCACTTCEKWSPCRCFAKYHRHWDDTVLPLC